MKYCFNYYGKDIELLNSVDEINVELSHIKNLERDLKEFCDLHKNQRINLIIDDYEIALNKKQIPYVFDFQQQNKEYNLYIRLPGIDKEYYPMLKDKYKDMKFFLNIYAKDWDTIQGLISENVTDIYIVEELGFDMAEVAQLIHENNIKIRVFPNVAQSSWKNTPAIKKFWIRPEDVIYYEDIVDIFEFYGEYNQQVVFYNIYANDKEWAGNLNNLIIDLNEDINSMCLLPRFGEKRVSCRHRCQHNFNCQMCNVLFDLSKNLEENKVRVKIDKNKKE